VLVHDAPGRENEVDIVIAAESVGPKHVATMRRDAGGLICVALHPKIADNFGLPYLTEVYEQASSHFNVLLSTRPGDLPYDERSAFSLAVNHRRTFTGITDIDRALTIRELGKLGAKALNDSMVEEFGRNFRSPGHVPLLRAADGLLAERKGHTELVITLAELADVAPVIAVCEMLDAETGKALSLAAASAYAGKRGLPCISEGEIVRAYGGK
jgi:3,4-dihydroxy 2-butanone 4-phosphate synthase